MGTGYFSADSPLSTPASRPIDWIGRCRGIVVIVQAQFFQEAKEQIVKEMVAMGFRAEEIVVEQLRGGA